MRILVTGASGFIGKNILKKWNLRNSEIVALYNHTDLVKFCAENNLKHVIPVQCDLASITSVRKAAQKYGDYYDVIVYLAANGDPAKSSMDPAMDLEKNTKYLINALEQFKCKKFLYFSSGAVYDRLKGPVSPRTRISPILPYAISKLASERYVEYFSKVRKSIKKYYLIRFFGAYGEFEPERKIFRRLLGATKNKEKIVYSIRGNGKNLIDAMEVSDTIRALEKIVSSNTESMVIDLASHTPLTISELVKKMCSICGCKVKIIREGTVPEYIQFRTVDKTMKNIFKFTPKVSMEEGIGRYMRWLEGGETIE